MLTNLDFLNPGMKFPPECEQERLDMYHNNKELFECEHAEVYANDLKRIERVIGNFQEVISYPTVFNFQKLMSLKIADLLFGEPPIITCGAVGSDTQKAVDKILEDSNLIETAYMTAIDTSRYGDGLFNVRKKDGVGIIDVAQPPFWFPVVSNSNLKDIVYNVIAWIEDDSILNALIYDSTTVEIRKYNIVNNVIGSQIYYEKQLTGLSKNPIIQISNVVTSDRITGIDDYTDIDSIVAELIVRVGQISRILDKHASPSMSGPQSAMEKDQVTGEWHMKAGGFFARVSSDDPDVSYIVWDANLDANFKEIDKLVNFLYTISEMGSAIFGDMTGSTGQVASGSALKRLMVSPLAKVNRIRMKFDRAIKQAIKLTSELSGINLMEETISIDWQDGLPADPVEEATIIAQRTGSKQTMSTKRAIQTYDKLSDSDIEVELAEIDSENSTAV